MTEKKKKKKEDSRSAMKEVKSWQIWNILVMSLASFSYCCLVVSVTGPVLKFRDIPDW